MAYYEREGIKILLGDVRQVVGDLPVCDLLVTDPPYGIGFESNYRADKWGVLAGDDDAGWVSPALDAVVAKALKARRHAYVFGPPELLPERLAAKVPLVWDKDALGTGDLSLPWSKSHEPITFAVHFSAKKERDAGRGGLTARMRQKAVIRVQRPTGNAGRHPTEKPVALLRQLIESSSCMGERVLDPFVGSGSTLVAAIAEGRVAVGVEIDERYAETAAKRVDAALDAMAAAASDLT